MTRAGDYGKLLAEWVNHTIDGRKSYREKFLEELKTYSLMPRKENEPVNEGCRYELSDLEAIDIDNPEHLAKLVKEGIHLMYQKNTAKKVLEALINKIHT